MYRCAYILLLLKNNIVIISDSFKICCFIGFVTDILFDSSFMPLLKIRISYIGKCNVFNVNIIEFDYIIVIIKYIFLSYINHR